MNIIKETAAAGSISAGAIAGVRCGSQKSSSSVYMKKRNIPNIMSYNQFKNISFKEFLARVRKSNNETN